MDDYVSLLRDIDLGNGAAEQDRRLQDVFVATADFKFLQDDRCDLITGVKGSGKSALFLMLLKRADELDRTMLVPAQNTVGPPVLMAYPPPKALELSDEYYELRWCYHAVSVAANEVARHHSERDPGERFWEAFKKSGLQIDRPSTIVDNSWMLSGKLAEQVITGNSEAREAADRLLNELLAFLETAEIQIWVLFDRLDEAFGNNDEREQAVLRGLLMAQIKILRFGGGLKVKLFVRHDLFDRVTKKSTLRNLDYLRRLQLNIAARELRNLVGRRVVSSPNFDSFLESQFGVDAKEREAKAVYWLLPTPRDASPTTPAEIAYKRLFLLTSDATLFYSPRNVINMLSLASLQQQRVIERDGLGLPTYPPLISERAIDHAWKQYSEDRLGNYVLAEFAEVADLVNSLKHQDREFDNLTTFARVLGLGRHDARDALERLKYCGVVREKSTGRIEVAYLYRPALQSKRPRGSLTAKRGRPQKRR